MKILKRLKRKVIKPKLPYRYTNEESIKKIVDAAVLRHGKEYCLDIGCGISPVDGCQTLDIKEEMYFEEDGKVVRTVRPDIVGDIRQLFAPGYMDELEDDSSLLEIPEDYYKGIMLHHIVEHIEWIYTDFFMRWVYNVLEDGGLVSIATPNAEVAARVYVENCDRIKEGRNVAYPSYEHPYCKEGIPWHVNKWLNFKFYSGCSPNDYHHSMFSSYALGCMLDEQGFEKISIYDGESIRALAYKSPAKMLDITEAERVAKNLVGDE